MLEPRTSPPTSIRLCALASMALAMSLAACSSSSAGTGGASPGKDAGEDANDAGNDGDAASPSTFKCGVGGLLGTLQVVDVSSPATSIAGVTISATGCTTVMTNEMGSAEADLATSPLKIRYEASSYVNELVQLTPRMGGFTRTTYLVPTSLVATALTGFTSDKGYAVVSIAPNGTATGPCSTADGMVVSVKGHPELVVGYMSDLSVRDPKLTATNVLGLAVVGPIPPGTYELDATKSGCTAGVDQGTYFLWPQTVDVEANALSFIQLKLP